MADWQKPYSGLLINSAHPLASGLVFCVQPGANNRIDHVNKKIGALLTSGSWNGITQKGTALESTSTSDGGAYWYVSPDVYRIGSELTFVALIAIDSSASWGCICSFPYHSASWNGPYASLKFGRYQAYSRLLLHFANSSSSYKMAYTDNYGFLIDGNLHQYGATRKGTEANFFLDGLPYSTLSNNFTADDVAWGDENPATCLNHHHISNGEGIDGRLVYCYLYNRKLSKSEIAWLHREPYAMFGQVSPVWALYSAGGGGGISIPVVMHYLNQNRR